LILWPASDNAQFMRPVTVNTFPTPVLKNGSVRPDQVTYSVRRFDAMITWATKSQ